jgi:hypothetical protein
MNTLRWVKDHTFENLQLSMPMTLDHDYAELPSKQMILVDQSLVTPNQTGVIPKVILLTHY